MDVKIKDVQQTQKELTISLDAGDMNKYLDAASGRLAQEMKVKGFREGKVPRKVVENTLGVEKLWKEALQEAVEDVYWQIIDEKKIEPIGFPKVDVVKLVPGDSFEFKAVVPIMPELALPDYKAIAKNTVRKEKKEIQVEDGEIESSLNWLRRTRSKPAEEGEKEKLPELNDEFAKSVGNFKDLDALKKSIREGLQKEKETRELQRVRLRILEEIRKKTDLDIADVLVEQELDKMTDELAQQTASMNMTLEEYLGKAQKTLEDLRKDWKSKAQERVAAGILLRAIADEEKIEAKEEEVEKEAKKYLQKFSTPDEAQESVDPERLRSYVKGVLRNERVFELLEKDE